MTTEKASVAPNRLVFQTLPGWIGAGGVVIYWLTLNHWISLASLGTVARISGWLWRPELERPFALAVYFPFRFLPAAWLPLALNLFTAGCGGLVLVLLARSVALLRHDILPEGAANQNAHGTLLATPTAWIPPVLAAVACGLQLTFWEHATAATGELFSLLCFAYAFRCLLEFRVTPEPFWLSRCACVYAAGMADNWILIGYFPLLLAAILWVKGLRRFWEPRFLLRMTGWGLAGLSGYLLLPALQGLSPDDSLDFWMTLKTHLRSQKYALQMMQSPELRLLVFTGLLPFLMLAIRWKSHTVQAADDTVVGVFFTKATGHFIHGLFFITACWIALNPILTPTNLDLSGPQLIWHYTWALGAGYGAGYLLLFGRHAGRRRQSKWPRTLSLILLGALTVLLLWKNLGEIRTTNGPAVHEFARELMNDLPAGQSVGLSEEARPRWLLRAELAAHRRDREVILVDTPSLVTPDYHKFMAGQFPTRWPTVGPTNATRTIGSSNLLALVFAFAERGPVVYLHPSSGFFFEPFRDEPNGTIHHLVARPNEESTIPSLTDASLATNEQIWQQRWTNRIGPLARRMTERRQPVAHWSRRLLKWLRLENPPNATAAALSVMDSKALNYWGVQLQRHRQLSQAVEWFRRSVAVNPENLAALINLEFAGRCQQGDRSRLTVAGTRRLYPELFGKYETWWEVLNHNGPVDEPTFLLQTGRVLLASGNYRQAVESLLRCTELATDWPAPQLWLVQSYNLTGNFVRALALADRVQATNPPVNGLGLAQLLQCRTTALRGLGKTNEATRGIASFVAEHGKHSEVLFVAATLYAASGQFEPELELRAELVRQEPANADWWTRKGLAELRLARYEAAIATFTHAISLAPADDHTRLLRAVAYLGAGQLEAARGDYVALLAKAGHAQSARFGLGGIAWQEHDTNAVMQYYQQFLSNSIAPSPQAAIAAERLKQLRDE